MATKEELVKGIAEVRANVSRLEAEVKKAEAVANKTWESRDREAFNEAENARLVAVGQVAKGTGTLRRLEGALDDFESIALRGTVEPLTGKLIAAIKAVCNEERELIAKSEGLTGYALGVGFRENGELNIAGATVSPKPLGAWFKAVAHGGGGGARTAGSHYAFTVEGSEYSEAAYVKAFADRVWQGDRLDRVLSNAKGENRIRNALRIAKEMGIVPTPITS